MEQLISIELFGQVYTFKADSAQTEARQATDLLEQEVARVEQGHNGPTTQMNKMAILISAALNIAHQHLSLQQDEVEFRRRVNARSDQLLQQLEKQLLSAAGT